MWVEPVEGEWDGHRWHAIQASRFGGSVFIIGVGKEFQQIPFMHASFREIDIRFQFRYHETYPKAISLVSEGLIDLKPLVTHRFTLNQAKEAFEAASTPAAKAVKVQLLDAWAQAWYVQTQMLNRDVQEARLGAECPCRILDNSLLPQDPLAEVLVSGAV
jgi:hypothetical protein